jgi:cell division protein FtsQ
VLALIVCAAAAYGGYRFVTWPGFALAHIEVRGERVTPRAQIVARAALHMQQNIWLQGVSQARSRIEALPYVRSATLHRVPPATIAIAVVERTVDGCLVGAGGDAALIDADGRVLENGCASAPAQPRFVVPTLVPPAPGAFVHDAGLARLQGDARALAAQGGGYASFAHDRFGDVEATLADGVPVEFGAEGDLRSKARLVTPILRAAGPPATIEALDLRAPAAPVVRYRSAVKGSHATPAP